MKRTALEKYLRQQGCVFDGHRTNHDGWRGPKGQPSVIGRHREINSIMVRKICKQLGVPKPPNP